MKVKYLATLLTASIVSLGLVTSCASPEGGETEADPDAPGTTEVDPCAGAADPCAGAADPCAAK